MKKQDIKASLQKVDSGKYSAEEERTAKLWLFQLNSDKEADLSEDKLNEVSRRMWAAIGGGSIGEPVHKRIALWPKIAVAAALFLAILGAGLFYFNSQKGIKNSLSDNVAANDVAPGRTGATLTLANGKKIRLSDVANGELAKQAGVTITKSANGELVYERKGSAWETYQINTISTAKGETYQVRLPDGSLVWLNAASSLTYSPLLIEGGRRTVRLTGEAYFQVAKDKVHPFIVQSRGQDVEVLGTHFNVNAYPDEPAIITTLIEGSVRLTAGTAKKVLQPGEQALNNEGSIKISAANVEKATDWKTGEFYVNHIDFKTAMRKIARWYDVEIIYNSSVPDDMEIGGWVSRNEKLSSVLKSIESAGLVRFKIEGRKIYVSK